MPIEQLSADRIAQAVLAALDDPSMLAAAQAMRLDIDALPPVGAAVTLLERMAGEAA